MRATLAAGLPLLAWQLPHSLPRQCALRKLIWKPSSCFQKNNNKLFARMRVVVVFLF
jgi:hypothetical protein